MNQSSEKQIFELSELYKRKEFVRCPSSLVTVEMNKMRKIIVFRISHAVKTKQKNQRTINVSPTNKSVNCLINSRIDKPKQKIFHSKSKKITKQTKKYSNFHLKRL